MKFKYNRVLVGRALVHRLAEKGFEVRVFDDLGSGRLENLREHLKEKHLLFVKGDVRELEAVVMLVRG